MKLIANFQKSIGAKATDNNAFLLTSTMPTNIQSSLSGTQTTVGNSFMSSSAIASAAPPPTNSQTTTTTHISAPSEVSQNTAISDRPKVKPVSKKDVKNLRKAAAVLQQNQIVSVYNNSVCI